MHRTMLGIAAAIVLLSTHPSSATTILETETEPVTIPYGIPDENPHNLYAIPFNSALGTLQSVSIAVSGTLTPEVYLDTYIPGTVVLTTNLGISGSTVLVDGPGLGLNGESVTLSQTVADTQTAGSVVAAGTSVPLSVDVGFNSLAPFEASSTTPIVVGLYSFETGSSAGGNLVDATTFVGQGTLTYTYAAAVQAVPEPATALPLASGLIGLGFARGLSARRRRRERG